ncbi:uncharacterized protein DNG_03424 [Cephalotrichum gorgonifer]|uniref:Myb-like domain-containing protein n=1 Tax=Cephalotrichum gorgonifer TaxID=2041049 RepID=A0AAE8MVA1_9PEZI|nr:uncharacterized protein DNG_03424 [Cephalotrichum gorgonifer]
MSLPKIITLETSPSKSTISFDVLEPSKVVVESQLNANRNVTASTSAMTITTEPIEGAAVPSLVYDASSSGVTSEDSRIIESGHDTTTSSGLSHSDDAEDCRKIITVRPCGHRVQGRARTIIAQDKAEESSPTADTEDSIVQHSHSGVRGRRANRWTDSQDALLLSMKEGGETWMAIATALGRGKRDVQRRFRKVKANCEEETDKNMPHLKKNSRAGGKSWSPKMPNKKQSRAMGKSTPSSQSSSQSESTDSSPDPGSTESEGEQQLYLQEQIRENLYPPYLSLEADDHFTKRDCAVLATVDSKMRRGKWLEMQANFFNATGKMVPLSVFRDKCEAAEAEERDRIREAKIKFWKAGLDLSEQLDPNTPGQFEQYA